MKRVIVFGTFDPLHAGHRNFFLQAKALGDHLCVIVARDSSIRSLKARDPFLPEDERVAAVAACAGVDEVRLGDAKAEQYALLDVLTFDVIALGYDQEPSNTVVRHELDSRGKEHVAIFRLAPYKPELYKSSHLRH